MHIGQTTRMIPNWQERWIPSPFGRGGRMESYKAGMRPQILERYECDHCHSIHDVIGVASEPFYCDCQKLISIETPDGYRVEHHGSSGRWYPSASGVKTLPDALTIARKIKSDGYGARIVRESDNSVVVDAPWQVELPIAV